MIDSLFFQAGNVNLAFRRVYESDLRNRAFGQ